ncbi:CbtB domain-containing protein [Jatrophihabitans fulvus]
MSTVTPSAPATPVVVSLPRAILQLAAVALFGLVVYYFVGLDQSMTSVFGNNTAVHEFVHDARHFLGFPCH